MNMEVVMERIEAKLDDIRDRLHSIDVARAETHIRQDALQVRVSAAEAELARLKTAHDKLAGVLKFVGLPSLASLVWGAFKLFEK